MIRAVLWRLQSVLSVQNRSDEAVAAAEQALELADKHPHSPHIATVLHDLAQIRLDEENYAEAERLARRSVQLHRRFRPPEHPETAYGLNKLGRNVLVQGEYREAIPYLRGALENFASNSGLRM